MIEKELSCSVIGAVFDVYNILGYGFLEHVYQKAIERELRERGHSVAREVAVPMFYGESVIAEQRLDMIVDNKLVLEIISTQELPRFATRQPYNYLRATDLELGLLLRFGPIAKFYRLVHLHDSTVHVDTGMAPPKNNNPSNPETSASSVAKLLTR
ncbi:MAG: GxxExxY protein [Gemmatimonadaceae bacterium]